jgi:hypothetical protein
LVSLQFLLPEERKLLVADVAGSVTTDLPVLTAH